MDQSLRSTTFFFLLCFLLRVQEARGETTSAVPSPLKRSLRQKSNRSFLHSGSVTLKPLIPRNNSNAHFHPPSQFSFTDPPQASSTLVAARLCLSALKVFNNIALDLGVKHWPSSDTIVECFANDYG
jgi:hypothetical protein